MALVVRAHRLAGALATAVVVLVVRELPFAGATAVQVRLGRGNVLVLVLVLVLVVGARGVWSVDIAQSVYGHRSRVSPELFQGYVASNAAEVWLCTPSGTRLTWVRIEVAAP